MTIRPISQQILRLQTGGSSPDPAIYCPANGFIPDPEVYVPPIPIPTTPPESITFICNAATDNWRCETNKYFFVKNGSAPYFYELFDNTGTLVDSWTSSAQWMDFDFPTNDRYYTVMVSLESPSYFTAWHNTEYFPTAHDDCIEAVIINCPTGFSGFGVKGNNNVTSVELTDATLANLNSLAYSFDTCRNMQYWKPKFELINALVGIYSTFVNSSFRKIDLSNLDTSSLNFSDSIAHNCKYLEEFLFPETWGGSRNYSMFTNTIRLRKVVMPKYWVPAATFNNSLAGFFQNSAVEGEIVFEEIPGSPVTNVSNLVADARNLQILRMKGNWENLSIFSGFFGNNNALEIFEAPRTLNRTTQISYSSWGTTPALKQYIGPDIGFMFFPSSGVVESITGEHDTSLFATKPNVIVNVNYRTTLQVFNCIKLQVSYLLFGQTASKFTALTALEIDWAGSPWASTTIPVLRLSAALPAAELNRIMTALPAIAGKVADLGWCDGYKDSDHTIANAKGWTVRGFAKIGNGSMSPIGATTATFNGQMDYLGGYTPVTAGVCFRTTPLPTTANNPKNVSLTAEGAFTVNITSGLAANTTYYARAYATSTYGTVYGDEFTFTTLP